GLPSFNVLFPSPLKNAGSALLQADQETMIPSEKEFFVFDTEQGEEKLWIIWSKDAIAEIEAVKAWVNERDRGNIKDSGQARSLKAFLNENANPAPVTEKDEVDGQTVVHKLGDVLVHLITLEHH